MLIMEVVRGGEQASAGERGEIVVTNLLNYAMPLIRYRVGDIGILDDKYCSCGRGLPLLKSIEGRMADCFALPGGQLIAPRTIMTAIQGSPGVSRYQAVQESMSQVRIQLMKRKSEPDAANEELVATCRRILGEDVEIEVSNTERTNFRAKFRPVISKVRVAEEPRMTG
jgi:phenylacetate-CoA ligase